MSNHKLKSKIIPITNALIKQLMFLDNEINHRTMMYMIRSLSWQNSIKGRWYNKITNKLKHSKDLVSLAVYQMQQATQTKKLSKRS